MSHSVASVETLPMEYGRSPRHGLVAVGQRATAFVLALAALFVFLAIACHDSHAGLVGAIGRGIGFGLTFLFGHWMAFAAPAGLAALAAVLTRPVAVRRVASRVVVGLVFIISLCALLSLSVDRPASEAALAAEIGFRRGGAIGEFLVAREGLNFPGLVGSAGAWIICVGAMGLSLLLMTEFFYARRAWRLLLTALETWRERRALRRARTQPFPAARVEPVIELHRRGGSSNTPFALPDPDDSAFDDEAPTVAVGVALDDGSPPEDDLFHQPITATGRREKRQPAKPRAAKADPPRSVQEELPLQVEYRLPPLDLLAPPPPVCVTSKEELYEIAKILERKLADFDIEAKVKQITQGPVITRFELSPAAGVKVTRILALERDLAMAMSAVSVRILAPIPGKNAVGIEIPNPTPSPVYLGEILESGAFRNQSKPLAFALGKTISGEPTVCDLSRMPHLLIAGATGSGKSVCLNTIICSILMSQPPERVRFIMIDPKRVELNVYQDIPHLLAPVVNDPRKAAGALNWMVEQMEDRYKLLSELGVRNIDGYHALLNAKEPSKKLEGRELPPMPHVVVVIDELADLMLIARNDVEETIIRLAQLARAVGIHLILATQRPSVNVITGIIKANFPARIAFQVSSKVDSRTIIDQNGAEALIGRGDMLYMPGNMPRPERLQGCFVSDQEVEAIANFIRVQQPPEYVMSDFKAPAKKDEGAGKASSTATRSGDDWEVMGQLVDDDGNPLDPGEIWNNYLSDDLFRAATRLVLEHRKASVSLIQRRLKIGFARSGRLIDMMQEAGIVGEYQGSKPRDLLVDPVEYLNLLNAYDRAMSEE